MLIPSLYGLPQVLTIIIVTVVATKDNTEVIYDKNDWESSRYVFVTSAV